MRLADAGQVVARLVLVRGGPLGEGAQHVGGDLADERGRRAADTVRLVASAAELLVEQRGCHGSGGELAWFNPATGTEQWTFRTGAGPAAVAYNDPANGGTF